MTQQHLNEYANIIWIVSNGLGALFCIPLLYSIIKSKSSEGQSVFAWIIASITSTGMLSCAILWDIPALILTNTGVCLANIITLICVLLKRVNSSVNVP